MSWLVEVERALADRPVHRAGLGPGLVRAAVLVPLFVKDRSLWVLLTRRTDALEHHAGETTFPGGRSQEGDDDEVATAFREADEELGLKPGSILLLGHLSDVVTASGFVISPVVGAIPWPVELKPRASEVQEVLPMPLGALASPTLVEEQEIASRGGRHPSPVLHYGRRRIAGGTAAILVELLQRLNVAADRREGSPPNA